MNEHTQIATILNIMKERGTIDSWHYDQTQHATVVLIIEGCVCKMTFLTFWSQYFGKAENAVKAIPKFWLTPT